MNKFSRVYIEITNICNLSCSFCATNVRTPNYMTVKEFVHILEEVKPYTNHIYLHVLGEPLLHPELEEILAVAKNYEMNINITTNGTLLGNTQNILLHAGALRKVSISLHSLEEGSVHKETYLKEVAQFVEKARKKGILCELRMWNLGAHGIDNEAIFMPLCQFLGLDEGEKENARRKILESGSIRLAKGLFLGTAEQFVWPSMEAKLTNQPIFCHGLRNQFAILCHGTVVPCCLDSKGDIPLGNIFETSLGEIFMGERAQNLYHGFSARQPREELCRRCGYATRF